MDADDDHVTPASEVSLSRPSSRTSAWSHTPTTSEALDGVHDLWPPGEFDDDEVLSSGAVQAIRTAKKSSIANHGEFTDLKSRLPKLKLAAWTKKQFGPQPSIRTTTAVRCSLLAHSQAAE